MLLSNNVKGVVVSNTSDSTRESLNNIQNLADAYYALKMEGRFFFQNANLLGKTMYFHNIRRQTYKIYTNFFSDHKCLEKNVSYPI